MKIRHMPVMKISVDRQDLDDYYNGTVNGIDSFSDIDDIIEEERKKADDEETQMLADEIIDEFRKGDRNAK
ncbi:MAG: hypothetical protein AMDU3_IPLC00004G0007 [Thermoplasmatales archaeon I-plasma]|nr:MAG: hypothetical protein AMDU3_IPLC00004G0007 [Thermoplasmatales archaeon I-plasma]